MKPLFKALAVVALASAASGCESFLDVNENVNNPIDVTPNALLASALATTAANYTGNTPSYNSYGSWTAGYWARSGTVNGYTEERTYNYTTAFYAGLFDNTYDNLEDYEIIQSKGLSEGYPLHAAIAQIMKVYNFQLLVDQYGDIPYTQALGGLARLSPKYDKAEDIYQNFVPQLDSAIARINRGNADPLVRKVGNEDVVFVGNMTSWKRFANSLKLRVLLRQSQVPSLDAYVRAQMTRLQASPEGFIAADVVVQPGYNQTAGRQNPFYNRYGFTSAGGAATERSYQIPTRFIIREYLANRDPRLAKLYGLPARPAGTTTYVGADLGENQPGVASVVSRFRQYGGLLKGFDAPTPLMLLAEYRFNRAEAETRGLFTGGEAAAKTNYLAGITASLVYFYRPAASRSGAAEDSSAFVTTANVPGNRLQSGKVARYLAVNVGNPKVDYDAATANGSLGKQSIILYQKYLAMNSVQSIEAWDDYRRTGRPAIPASLESTSPRADKLPTRLLYPQSETTTNSANVPRGTTQYTKVFWDVVD